jgi:hypothetical protein
MELLKEAFIEGYKQRAESSDLIFDNVSRMYAISLFDKWKSEQLLLHNVSQQRELLFCGGCGNKKELIVETDINSQKVCKNKLCEQNNCG